MDLITGLIQGLLDKAPFLATLLVVVGFLRLINKPLLLFLHSLVDATPTNKDNLILDDVEKSGFYKGFVFVLDWLGSVKLPEKK